MHTAERVGVAIAFLTSVAKMANVFNVRGGHAFMDRMCAFLCVLMEREHCRLSQKLENSNKVAATTKHYRTCFITGNAAGGVFDNEYCGNSVITLGDFRRWQIAGGVESTLSSINGALGIVLNNKLS